MSNDGQCRKEGSQEYPLQSGTDGMVRFSILILQLALGYYNVFEQCIAYIHGLMQEITSSLHHRYSVLYITVMVSKSLWLNIFFQAFMIITLCNTDTITPCLLSYHNHIMAANDMYLLLNKTESNISKCHLDERRNELVHQIGLTSKSGCLISRRLYLCVALNVNTIVAVGCLSKILPPM